MLLAPAIQFAGAFVLVRADATPVADHLAVSGVTLPLDETVRVSLVNT
jgi:hypothetical protein